MTDCVLCVRLPFLKYCSVICEYFIYSLLDRMSITRRFLNWYARLSPSRGKTNPPYEHVVQIGDPRLRRVCDPIPMDKIKTNEVQSVIKKLEHVLNKYNSVGMSAPQIGVNIRIFVMRFTADQVSKAPAAVAKLRGLEVVPFTVFVNPKLKVVDFTKVAHGEGCESVQGYEAEVPRFKEVEVSGYNANGEPTTKVYKDWTARIAQHEIEHLDGKLYVDNMDRKTLTCTCWEEVNLSKGKVVIPFIPK